jgi:hypothetical protein
MLNMLPIQNGVVHGARFFSAGSLLNPCTSLILASSVVQNLLKTLLPMALSWIQDLSQDSGPPLPNGVGSKSVNIRELDRREIDVALKGPKENCRGQR